MASVLGGALALPLALLLSLLQAPVARGATLVGNGAKDVGAGYGAGHGAHGGVVAVVGSVAGASSVQGTTAYLSLRTRAHQANMDRIMANMTVASALATLRAHGHEVSPAIVALVQG
eukprot:TRINITY_DN19057_c0_g1_i1.p2 TRINITY_DN19057_c0_g1~~TRINITY_DN19057_c0_g1_i1.p2  ORF type:complete len:117 (+),score=23.51 TRINITY_DN19057_c0_g1_i1:21-371(+)